MHVFDGAFELRGFGGEKDEDLFPPFDRRGACQGHGIVGETTRCAQGGDRKPGGKSLMCFLELPQELGVYSRVTAGMSIRKSSLFIEVRNLSRYEGQLRNVN